MSALDERRIDRLHELARDRYGRGAAVEVRRLSRGSEIILYNAKGAQLASFVAPTRRLAILTALRSFNQPAEAVVTEAST